MDVKSNIYAEVLNIDTNGFYRIKISIIDQGVYIFGFRAKNTEKGWWVQPPSTKTPNGWKMNPEFDKSKPLWKELEKECVRAISEYVDDADLDMSDDDYAKKLDDVFASTKSQASDPWKGL